MPAPRRPGWLDNVECVRAGFLSYEHVGAPADAVFTRNALHQLPDFWKAIALHRIAGLLRPGGVLRLHDLIFDFQPADAETVLGRWLDSAAQDPSQGYTRADFAEHIRTEFSTFRWLLEPMLTATGFDIVTSDFHKLHLRYLYLREALTGHQGITWVGMPACTDPGWFGR